MNIKNITEKYQIWIDVRKKFKLTDVQIQMARELGLNPKNFGSLNNNKQEPWKLPLNEFIEELYFKRFKKSKPDKVISIEEYINEIIRKKKEKQIKKVQKERSIE
jgi:hypothetical protein